MRERDDDTLIRQNLVNDCVRETRKIVTPQLAFAPVATFGVSTRMPLDFEQRIDGLGNKSLTQTRPLILVPLGGGQKLGIGFRQEAGFHLGSAPRMAFRARSTESRQSIDCVRPSS
jgi:hypothetical protein